ncbi:MAG TPA: tetratricopeptide repeat protein, partial [Ktedonobacterales bacterium]|nr:tetratricopeptide repeat protein [Ktedonobacterales bacterium]
QGLTVEELQKRITDAHATAERIAAEAPQAPEQTLANNRQAAEAVRSVTGALTSSMHYSDALVVKLPLDESAYRAAIQDARTLGSHERAAALLERMQGRFADDVQTRFELGIEQYLTAEQYGQQGQAVGANGWLDRAIATMTQVVADEPTAQHLQGLGELLARQGHFSQAEARMREAVALDDTNATLHADLAEAIMGRFGGEDLDQTTEPTDDERKALARQALTALRDASKRDSSLPRLFTRMGAIYEALGQHDDAIITFQEAIRRDPTDDTAYYSLGTLFLSRRQADQALPLLQMATQHEPTSVQYRLSLASCYALLNQNREATQQLDLIDRLQPGLPQVAELRAILARQTKK